MSKVIFEFDGTKEPYDIALCTHRVDLAIMIQDIQDYARTLRKYENREQIPAEEVESKISDIISKWNYIQGD